MHPVYHAKITVSTKNFPRSEPEQAIDGPDISSSRVVNSKIPYTLTLSLPFVVRNQDLDHYQAMPLDETLYATLRAVSSKTRVRRVDFFGRVIQGSPRCEGAVVQAFAAASASMALEPCRTADVDL